jgi:hypothetical protein
VKKKFERRTLEVQLHVFALTVDGFQWEASDRLNTGKASRMPLVLIGWIQCWRFWREKKMPVLADNQTKPITIQVFLSIALNRSLRQSYAVHSLLSCSLVSKNMKIKIYRTIIFL